MPRERNPQSLLLPTSRVTEQMPIIRLRARPATIFVAGGLTAVATILILAVVHCRRGGWASRSGTHATGGTARTKDDFVQDLAVPRIVGGIRGSRLTITLVNDAERNMSFSSGEWRLVVMEQGLPARVVGGDVWPGDHILALGARSPPVSLQLDTDRRGGVEVRFERISRLQTIETSAVFHREQ